VLTPLAQKNSPIEIEALMIRNTTVAFLDILGFGQMIETRTISDLSQAYEKQIGDANRHIFGNGIHFLNFAGPKLFPNHSPTDPLCALHVFSDSLILIANGSDEESCLKLLIYAWRISQTFLVAGFPLRGGVAFGEMYCNPQKSIILGKALTVAHALEKEQNWVGISIDNSVLDQFSGLKASFIDEQNILAQIFRKYPGCRLRMRPQKNCTPSIGGLTLLFTTAQDPFFLHQTLHRRQKSAILLNMRELLYGTVPMPPTTNLCRWNVAHFGLVQ
jgi:hypothetical protein